jgi:hypothetical protein
MIGVSSESSGTKSIVACRIIKQKKRGNSGSGFFSWESSSYKHTPLWRRVEGSNIRIMIRTLLLDASPRVNPSPNFDKWISQYGLER